jgi:hypothetical protein
MTNPPLAVTAQYLRSLATLQQDVADGGQRCEACSKRSRRQRVEDSWLDMFGDDYCRQNS